MGHDLVPGASPMPLKRRKRELVEMVGRVHRTEIGHVVRALQLVRDVEQPSDQPSSRWHLHVDQSAGRKPVQCTHESRSGIVEMLKYRTEAHKVEGALTVV